MPISVVTTAYGRAASDALREAVARAKGADALAPVSVIVPTNSVGVAARRRLAASGFGPASPGRGVVAVTFLTVYRLAELLAAPTLAAAGRRPVSTPVVASAVRRALARDPGSFAPVANHPATEEALVAAHRELADLDDVQLDVLAARHPRARDVVRLHRATRELLAAGWYDEHALLAVATELVGTGHALVGELGAIVCYLPQSWPASTARLLCALGERSPVTIVAGVTGDPRADAAVVTSLTRAGAALPGEASSVPVAAGTDVFSASDPDDEVRAIVREVAGAMRAGTPLESMAVLYGSRDPYARLVHEHLDLAGIVHNGAAVTTLVESVLGRGLVALLALADGMFARDAVCAFCATAPVLDGRGREVPAVAWDRVSRLAGVVRGHAEWHRRLDAYIARLADDGWGARERARAAQLRDFVDALVAELDRGRSLTTWSALARWTHRLVRRFFGDETRRATWPEREQAAAARVEAVIDRLGALDAVERAPTLDVFRRSLELELRTARERVGRLGEGLLAGPVGFALGVELERVWVCGLAEGLFPAVPHGDPLLADDDRAALDGALRLASDRVDDDHRALLGALASTAGARVCSYPRGDLRRSTERVASRFLAPTVEHVGDLARTIPSYAHALARVAFPPNEHELAVQGAIAGCEWVRALPETARGIEATAARASDEFTRFDGNLAPLGERLRRVSPVRAGAAIAPTRLEAWAACPHAYFVGSILHVDVAERPEEIWQLAPVDRGQLVHEVLDEFVGEVRDRAGAGRPWTSSDRARLHELAHAACARAEVRGVTGRRLLWDRDRRLIVSELDAFLDADTEYRTERDACTLATELAFGIHGASAPTVEVPLGANRVLHVRGKADRVDRRADGSLVVIDYKTGSPDAYTALGHDDPVLGGTRLQLPVYARAARAAFGEAGTAVAAFYWFVGRGNNRLIGYDVDAEVDAAFESVVGAIVDGIEGGVFVANPPPPGPRPFVICPYCDPDGLGTAQRWREWEHKYDAPELAPYRALLDPASEAGVS